MNMNPQTILCRDLFPVSVMAKNPLAFYARNRGGSASMPPKLQGSRWQPLGFDENRLTIPTDGDTTMRI
jgi:hypothetical protein